MPQAYSSERAATIISEYVSTPGALLPVLHAIQDTFGHIPPEAIALIASSLNLSRAEVHGVATYYQHFRSTPAPRHLMQICCAESCQAMGAENLVAIAEQNTSHSKPGDIELQPVYCLGLCGVSPAVQLDDQLHGRVTPQKLKSLLDTLEKQR